MSLNQTNIGYPLHQSLSVYNFVFFFPSRNVKRNNPLMLRTRINTLVSTLDNCIFFYMFVIYIDAIIRFSCTLFIVQNLLIL